jgi:hypothetical protein
MFLAIQRILQPIEAEASALLLAAKLAAAVNVQRPVFITDNEVLATVANRRDLLRNLGHWSLRPILGDFTATTANMMHSIIKIGRDANSVADNLTKKARQAAIPSSCLFSCESWTHSRNCTIQMALENFQWGNFCPIFVFCI